MTRAFIVTFALPITRGFYPSTSFHQHDAATDSIKRNDRHPPCKYILLPECNLSKEVRNVSELRYSRNHFHQNRQIIKEYAVKTSSFTKSSRMLAKKNNVSIDEKNTESFVKYNDDAFGLVVLTNLFVSKDYLFCALFTGLSFIAVLRSTKIESSKFDDKLIPGLVALISFSLTIFLNLVIPSLREVSLSWNDLHHNGEGLTTSHIYEVVVITLSFIYSLFQFTVIDE